MERLPTSDFGTCMEEESNAGGTTAGRGDMLVPLDVFRWHLYWRSVLPNFGGFTTSAFNSSQARAMATAMVYC